ncbi:hypothetical protein MNBD_GAMMA05-1710 [hydrothermal vent metagenome]|uniref:Rho-specific inhibitor of transcription termination (YaeO) n=1 Tax=hydrothermal vent metagenome TaxID=652676 RepID=A0A3B0WKV9_9ZZZZ
MNKPYQPILCALHDEFEIAIMHKKTLDIQYLDNSGSSFRDTVLPLDLLVKNKEEYLLVKVSGGEELNIRLDKIILLD